MDCKKCPYYESRKELTNTGKVVVGFCRLRSKHMTDLTIRNGLCKDRATVDIPSNARTTKIEPEKKLFSPEEAVQLKKAEAKRRDSPTLGQLSQAANEAETKRLEQRREQATKPACSQPSRERKAEDKRAGPLDEDFLRKAVWGGGR